MCSRSGRRRRSSPPPRQHRPVAPRRSRSRVHRRGGATTSSTVARGPDDCSTVDVLGRYATYRDPVQFVEEDVARDLHRIGETPDVAATRTASGTQMVVPGWAQVSQQPNRAARSHRVRPPCSEAQRRGRATRYQQGRTNAETDSSRLHPYRKEQRRAHIRSAFAHRLTREAVVAWEGRVDQPLIPVPASRRRRRSEKPSRCDRCRFAQTRREKGGSGVTDAPGPSGGHSSPLGHGSSFTTGAGAARTGAHASATRTAATKGSQRRVARELRRWSDVTA